MAGKDTPVAVTGNAGNDDVAQELARLRKENADLKQNAMKVKDFAIKVGEKGGVVMNVGNSRYPLSPYAREALTVLENKDAIANFVLLNIEKLAHGPEGTDKVILDETKARTIARAKAILGTK